MSLTEHIRNRVRRGYRPPAPVPAPIVCVAAAAGRASSVVPEDGIAEVVGAEGRGGLAVLLPTLAARAGVDGPGGAGLRLLAQAAEARDALGDVPVVFLTAMQWADAEEREGSLRRLASLGDAARMHGLPFVGLSLPVAGKIRSLNAAIGVAEAMGARALAWVDDDVQLEPGCLRRMASRLREKGWRGAVGATKVPAPGPFAASRLLHAAKAVAEPAVNYPHACCILVALEVVAGGIPPRYVSDDGYVCFRLLDPSLPDPRAWLELVPTARCHYQVGGPAGETARRLRRMMLNHHIYLADFPVPVGRFYFRRMLFTGLWPLAPWDGSRGWSRGAAKAALQWLYFGWFCAVGAELYLRGLLDRPLRRVAWGTAVVRPLAETDGPVRATAKERAA
jgi:hypothetical protein